MPSPLGETPEKIGLRSSNKSPPRGRPLAKFWPWGAVQSTPSPFYGSRQGGGGGGGAPEPPQGGGVGDGFDNLMVPVSWGSQGGGGYPCVPPPVAGLDDLGLSDAAVHAFASALQGWW